MKRLKTHRPVFLFIAFLFAVIIYLSCKKAEQPAPVPSVSAEQKTFFTVPVNTSPVVARIINVLNRENEKSPFAETMVKNAGYPQWMASKIKLNSQLRQLNDDMLVNIPMVKKGAQETTAILVVNIQDADTSFQLVYPQDYVGYLGQDTMQGHQSAAGLFNVFANFDYELFGTTQYLINDGRIFGWERNDTLTVSVTHPDSAGTANGRVNMSNAEISTVCNALNVCPTTSFRRVANNASLGGCIVNVECTVMVIGAPAGGSLGSSGGGVIVGGGSGGATNGSNSLTTSPCSRTINVNGRELGTNSCSGPWDALGGGHLCGSYSWKVIGDGLYAQLYNAGFSLINTDGELLTFMFMMPCIQFSNAGGLKSTDADFEFNNAWNYAVDRVTADANTRGGPLDDFTVKQNMKRYIAEYLSSQYGKSASFNPQGCNNVPVSKVKYCN